MKSWSTAVRMTAFAVAAVVVTACSESTVAPEYNVTTGSAAFARNGSVTPNPDKNKSCDTDNGTKKRTSADKPDGKNACNSSPSYWLVNTGGLIFKGYDTHDVYIDDGFCDWAYSYPVASSTNYSPLCAVTAGNYNLVFRSEYDPTFSVNGTNIAMPCDVTPGTPNTYSCRITAQTLIDFD